ncbi:hypothetical protein HMPREF9413_6075 [Paenibacillus sp. HGF7]|nr:hypothetical protein HMPREF9413_6075 [Paenibacillus sp. HGF7]
MAKDQNLSLNPTKISGLCGRLMCCLKFEHDNYESAKDSVPSVGTYVITSLGNGKVLSLNMNEKTCKVQLYDIGKIMDLPFDDVAEQD